MATNGKCDERAHLLARLVALNSDLERHQATLLVTFEAALAMDELDALRLAVAGTAGHLAQLAAVIGEWTPGRRR
jgi:hypothetical protein